MIEEKTRRSKTYHNNKIGVCAKSVQSPIVLLQRLHIGANSAILAKEFVTDNLSNSMKFDKVGAPLVGNQKSIISVLRNSSDIILNDSQNEETSIQCTTSTEAVTVAESTVVDLNSEIALSTTKSYKFKKKLKRLKKLPLDTSTDKKFSYKIREVQKVLTDVSTTQQTKISTTVSTRKKLSEKTKADDDKKCTTNNDSEQHNLKKDPFSEHDSTEMSSAVHVDDYKTSKVDNSLPDSSTSNTSQSISNILSSHKKNLSHSKNLIDLNNVDNSVRTTISTRNKLCEITKTNESQNAFPMETSNEYSNLKTIEKIIPANEATHAIEDNDEKNTIKTRSKVREMPKADNSERSPSVPKSTPKCISNKSLSNEKIHEAKEFEPTGVQDNSNIKKAILMRSKLSDTKKTDHYETKQSQQSNHKINLPKVQTNSKFLSVGKNLGNLKFTTDTIVEKEPTLRSTISTRSKLQEQMKVDDDISKRRQSLTRNKGAELVKNSSKSKSSQIQTDGHSSSSKKIPVKPKVNSDSLAIKENQIVENRVSTRAIEKKKINSKINDTVENVVIQPKDNNSTPNSSHMQIHNESHVSENMLDHSMSSTDLSIVEEKSNERTRISTRSKTLDKNIIENNLLHPKKALSTFAVSCEKSLQSRKSNDTSKSIGGSSEIKENNDNTSNISTRSRLLEKKKLGDNKQLTIENPSIEMTVQSEQNHSVSTLILDQISDEFSLSEKILNSQKHFNLTRTPKIIDTQSTISTRSKVGKKKTDSREKSDVENETMHLNKSPAIQIIEQLIPNDPVQDSLKILTDLPKTKENISTSSQSLKKKKTELEKSDVENKTTHSEQNQTENIISTRSKILETDTTVDQEKSSLQNDTSHIVKDNATTNSSGAVISNKPSEIEKILSSPKRLTKSPKKIEIKSIILTRSKLLENNGTEIHEESSVEKGATYVEQNHSTFNSIQVQTNSDSTLDINNSQRSPSTDNINDLSNTIATRSGLHHKTRRNAKSPERKKKSFIEKHHSSSNSQAHNESIVHKHIGNISLQNEIKGCNINGQQQVCYKKEIVIKLFRCDQTQPTDNCPIEKETPKKSLKGKRKVEHKATVKETPKAKKSKQINSSDNSTDLPITDENQPLIVDNQVQLSTIEDTGKLVEESQSTMESDMNDINIMKSIENISENREEIEKNICSDNLSDINMVANTDFVTKNPEVSEKENECDNKHMENEKEIIVNSSGDHNSVHEEEILEDRGEGVSIDTSENETNTETLVKNSNMIVEKSTPTTVTHNKEGHSLLARKMVEEVINDWAVADDGMSDNNNGTEVNQDLSTPEVIQIDDSDDVDIIVDVPQQAVSTAKEVDERNLTSHNLITTPRKNAEINCIDISNSPQKKKGKSISGIEKKSVNDKQCRYMEKDTLGSNSTSEQTSEISETEEIDSNFESIDEGSSTETFAAENFNDQEVNVSQETITYYNSEDISMEVGVPVNENRLNDVVMSLKDACDKITADLSGVNASYENNEEASNHHVPELLCISDDSNEEQEEEILIIEPTIEAYQYQSPPPVQQSILFSDHLRNVMMHQGSPSISVIKASELRDEALQPPVQYPVKSTDQHNVVYPQRQMHSTTLLPASVVNRTTQLAPTMKMHHETQLSSMMNEDTIMPCPKCRCEFVGKTRLRRHWLTCGDAMYLYCPFCPNKVKQRRSLINHLNSLHSDHVDQHEAVKMVEQIVKQTREAAGVKLKQGCQLAVQDFLRTASTVPMIELPAFIRIQCVVCNKIYDEVPATYKKTCDECSSDLMTANCQLCRKQYMLSTKVAVHVQGNCIFTGRVKCRECGFVSSGRYHLQEHIIRKHIYVAPEDYVVCGLGCGKTFRVNDALKKHERICAKEADLDCRFCDYKTKHRSAMKMHVQQHILHEKLSMDTDGSVKVFGQSSLDTSESQDQDDVRDLITEQQVRSVIRVHCSRCNRTLRLTSNRSSCEICKLSFTFSCSRCPDSMRLDSLHAARLHVIRSHSVKIHECPQCSVKFSYVYDLTRHASKCIAKTICCERCNYRTNKESKLRDHKRRVHFANGKSRVSCKKCGKWFIRGDSLKRHENSNCGLMPLFSCEHCHFKTKTKFSLLRHIQSQHAYIYEHFSFVCDRCNKFYTNMFAYEIHVKNCHALVNN